MKVFLKIQLKMVKMNKENWEKVNVKNDLDRFLNFVDKVKT